MGRDHPARLAPPAGARGRDLALVTRETRISTGGRLMTQQQQQQSGSQLEDYHRGGHEDGG